jgi:hypothetical protein
MPVYPKKLYEAMHVNWTTAEDVIKTGRRVGRFEAVHYSVVHVARIRWPHTAKFPLDFANSRDAVPARVIPLAFCQLMAWIARGEKLPKFNKLLDLALLCDHESSEKNDERIP